MRLLLMTVFTTTALMACVDAPPDDLGGGSAALTLGWCDEQPIGILNLPAINVEEPFVRTVGSTTYLYFSDRLPDERRDLHRAVWVDNVGFVYLGQLGGVNTAAGLEGAPSIDAQGRIYYTNAAAPGMISYGLLVQPGLVWFATPLTGVPPRAQYGTTLEGNMDIGVAWNLPFAALSRASWRQGSSVPSTADLWYLRRNPDGSVVHDWWDSIYFFRFLNTGRLEYAPEFSASGLEIFYTDLDPATLQSRIMTASRQRLDLPFNPPSVVTTNLPGTLIEGPTVTIDGNRLFFHQVRFDGQPSGLRTMRRCLLP